MTRVILVLVVVAVLGVVQLEGIAESSAVFIAGPMLFGALLAIMSVRCTMRVVRARHVIMSVAVLFTVLVAEMTLVKMALGAWPTYLPYTLLGVAAPVAVLQWLVARRERGSQSGSGRSIRSMTR